MGMLGFIRSPRVHHNHQPSSSPLSLFLLPLIFISCNLLLKGSYGLKSVQLQGPSFIRIGENLRLRCNYDTESESLYAVKWYRGEAEFYRYLPKEVPPQQVFPVDGILVDMNNSDDHNVMLRNVSRDSNGKFKCVVSAEGSFQTLNDVKDISVVAIGYDAPKLYPEKLKYHPGEIGKANCTLEKTYPTANLTWYINDKQVSDYATQVKNASSGLTSIFSTILFNISSRYSPIHVKCKGSLYDIYDETSSTKIQPIPATFPNVPDPLLRSNSSTFLRGSGVKGKESHLSHLLTAQLFLFIILSVDGES